jgi:hypothetical protein
LLVVTLVGIAGCRRNAPADKASPTDCIRAMSRFSREGRVDEYLDCFTGDLRTKLEQARDEMEPGAFAELLRRRAEPVRGIAISDQNAVDEMTTRVKVEWVFENRNESQAVTLRKVNGLWKIAAMTEAQFEKPKIPYGTKVSE